MKLSDRFWNWLYRIPTNSAYVFIMAMTVVFWLAVIAMINIIW